MLSWKMYQSRKPDEAELVNFFGGKTFDEVGIALVTGELSGVAVLDCDDKAGGTFGYDSKMKARSGSGGTHLFYKWRKGIENRARIQGDPLDVRGEGGYLIIPPSKHPCGNSYLWLINIPDIREIASTLDPFPEIPEITKEGKGKEQRYKIVNVSEGSRNDNMYRFACSLDMKPPKEVWHSMVMTNRSYTPPLPEEELKIIYNQAIKHNEYKEAIQPRSVDSLLVELKSRREKEVASVGTGFPVLDSLIKGFLPGHLYALTGETNSGKTTLAVNFAHRLAKMNQKVLYISLEPDIQIITMLASLDKNKAYNQLEDKDFEGLPDVKILLQEDCQSFDELKKIIENSQEFDLIIIDHIGYFVVDGDWVQGQSKLIKQLALLTKQQSQAVLYVVHPNKGAKGEGIDRYVGLNDMMGTSAHRQDCTEVLSLQREQEKDEYGCLFTSPYGKIHVLKSKVSGISKFTSVDIEFAENKALVDELIGSMNSVRAFFPNAKEVLDV
jgi:archaellum biogenesis ATPase FlaH